jgi:hypothetical protein
MNFLFEWFGKQNVGENRWFIAYLPDLLNVYITE